MILRISCHTHIVTVFVPLRNCLQMATFFWRFLPFLHSTTLESLFQGMYNMMTWLFTLLHIASLVNVLENQLDAKFECPVVYDKMSQVH